MGMGLSMLFSFRHVPSGVYGYMWMSGVTTCVLFRDEKCDVRTTKLINH